MAKATKWLPLFRKFVSELRIQSKHAAEDIDGTGIELKLWTSQTRVLEQICSGLEEGIHTYFILKSRQLGVTTITLAILLFWLAFNPNTIGCLVSDSEKNAAKNREMIKRYLMSLDAFMGKGFRVVKNNRFGVVFSNGSRLDFLVAGTKKAWGEGEGYLVGHLTECANYGKEEGLESFRHSMAPDNPRALYIYESTAHGPNHWKTMWEAARQDEFTSRCIFVGWWSNDLQRIKRTDRRFQAFGTQPPTPEENEKVVAVKHLYDFDITMEQLAWVRSEAARPNANETDMDQNQPWTEMDAFIQSGVSFFQQRRVSDRREEITSAPHAGVEDGGYGYKAYSFYLGDEYHYSKVEAITTAVPPDMIKLRVWEKPHPEGIYAIGVDPAGGRSELSNNHNVSVWRAFADKLVQVAEWADSVPETRHCAWVMAYLAGQYANCRINVDLTGGIGTAIMQSIEDLRSKLKSELYQAQSRPGNMEFEDFLAAASWHMYRRIDSPGPGFLYNTVMGRRLKFDMMNILRDSWVTNGLEIRSVPLLDEMSDVVQDNADIGASAPGHKRDDRTFGMALANWVWVKELRPMLISNGVTWEGSRLKETGVISPAAEMLNRRVWSIMRAADEAEDLPPPRNFFEQRGLS